ncbi:unnamed protein product [Linum tenue]|uniref:Uncharacterized protein n=1 Tax=Linum tenue TaxID=586396 RepID=A0AAV0I883_9ROSI|nr:unnamed protein product [Linum tenue]
MLPFDLQTSLPEQRNSGRPHALVCYGFGNRQHKTNGSTKPNKHTCFLSTKETDPDYPGLTISSA